MSAPARVFHCDDSPAFRMLVREMLEDLGGVQMVGEATTLDEALATLGPAAPDVVLVDLFDHARARQLVELLRGAAPGARLLLYTGMPESLVPPGADGYLHKSASFEELHRTIAALAVAP